MDTGRIVAVGENSLNVYSEGEGETALVFMSGSGVGCPVLEYKPLYRRLSGAYRVAVVEKAGYGSSSPAKTPRTVENLVDESRAALKASGIEPPYVLVPHSYSGFEAIYWANTYPGEVKAVLGLDMGLPNLMAAMSKDIPLEKKKKMVAKTRSLMQKIAKRGLLDKLLRSRTVGASGILEGGELSAEEKAFYEETYYKNIASEAVFEESVLAEENARKAAATGKLSRPACLVVGNMKSAAKGLSWRGAAEEYAKECGAELHFFDEGHMRLHTRRADEITAIYKAFLGKLGLDGRG